MLSRITPPGIIRQRPTTGVCDHAHGHDDPLSSRHSGNPDLAREPLHRIDPGTDLHDRGHDLGKRRHAPGVRARCRSGRLNPRPFPASKTLVIDASDAGAGATVAAGLSSRGITSLDAAAISHAHADHIGEYQTILSRFPVGRFYDPGYPQTSST